MIERKNILHYPNPDLVVLKEKSTKVEPSRNTSTRVS